MERINWDVQKLTNPEKIKLDFGLLILNQPILCDSNVIKSLWKNATRILVDGGSNRWLTFLEKWKLNLELPDFISGDFDSITSETRHYFEKRKVKMIFTPAQDDTDFTKALCCAGDAFKMKTLNIKYVVAVCENSGRFDQIIANINTLHRSSEVLQDIPIILFSSECITWILHPGNHSIFVPEEFVRKRYSCGLIPFCGPTVVTTSGLKWNIENHTMEMGSLISTSNTYAATEISVECDRRLVWTSQY